MPARLVLLLPHRPVRHLVLDPEKTYLIGRSPGCDIRLDDSRLSRRHAELSCLGGSWEIHDLDSKNGLLVDGQHVDRASLKHPAWLSLGGVLGRYEEVSEESLHAEARQVRDRWATTQELASRLDPELGLEPLLRQVLDSVLELTGLRRGFVLLTDAQGRLRLAARRDLSDDELRTEEFTGSWGAIRMAVEERRVLVSTEISAIGALSERPSVIAGGIRALACIPLEIDERLTGVVYADSTEAPREFTELDIELLESLCSQAAIALSVARLSQQLGHIREQLGQFAGHPEEVERMLKEELPEFRKPADERELARTALEEGLT